ncbi:MAG: efflux RND transporter permease subunit, partial [Planctomycetales bacterium]|nr:efflux RND transporter permease subunit [Planctomycetales bacterium]
NLMSLGAIDFGLLVDGSVVMVENALRRLSQDDDRPRHQVLLESAQEVGRPIAFGIGIIIVVYLPVMSLTGMEGKMFHPMAFTVVFALLGSLLLALTTTPVLVSLLVGQAGHASRLDGIKARYRRLLEATLARPLPIAIGAVTLFALSLVAFSRLGAEFIPELDEGALAVQAIRLPSISLTASLE